MSDLDDFREFWDDLRRTTSDRDEAIHAAYQRIENAGVLSKVTVHTYVCGHGCGVLMRVIKLGEVTLARTRDFKQSDGKNREQSVPEARRKNTLDGNRHWPGHTFDVEQLAEWGPDASMITNCRHSLNSLRAVDVLATVEGVRQGHPGKPTKL